MTNEIQSTNAKRKYNLEERTAKFGEQAINFVMTLEQNPVNKLLISQVVRSATSIGANYMGADVAGTKKDFKHKIGLCRKEAKELTLIFSSIFNS